MTTGSEPSAGTGLGALLAAIKNVADCGAAHWRTCAGQGLGELAEGAVGQRSTLA